VLKRTGEICVDQQGERNGQWLSVKLEKEALDLLEQVDDLELPDQLKL
jgi:hypothetical protein